MNDEQKKATEELKELLRENSRQASDGKSIGIEKIEVTGERLMEHLGKGEMVVAAAKNEFLYLVEESTGYEAFMHIPGTPEGQHRTFPKSEQSAAALRGMVKLAEELYAVEYDRKFDLNSVLVAAEQAVLSSRQPGKVRFFVPGQEEGPENTAEKPENP